MKMFEIKHKTTGAILFKVEAKTTRIAVELAVKSKANLSKADLSGANLSGANLSGANLSGANLSGANLSGVDLSGVDLFWANLSKADLSGANLSGVDLFWADLSGANLSGANLDFSSGFSFRCGSLGIKADLRLAAQMAYHFCRFDFGDCDEAKAAQQAIKELANKFHRVAECGKID